MVRKYRVLGLTVIKYIGEAVSGHNCNFDYEPAEFEKVIVHLQDVKHKGRLQFELSEEEGECGSGWTTASFGYIYTCDYEGLPFTHIPKDKSLTIELDAKDVIEKGDIKNEVFIVSLLGEYGDFYYPMGYYEVNMDLFEKLPRAMEKRPVYIFSGASGLGKTSLGTFSELKIYDTDCSEELEEVITEDIIVLGNKYNHTFEDIKDRIFGDYKPIFVNFTDK